jgi:regulatory protein YycH of two-component signal transduction system YycFG
VLLESVLNCSPEGSADDIESELNDDDDDADVSNDVSGLTSKGLFLPNGAPNLRLRRTIQEALRSHKVRTYLYTSSAQQVYAMCAS